MKTILALALALTSTATFAAPPAITAAQAFASIKKLEGRWTGPSAMKGMPPGNTIFRTTAGGSAVHETIFPGSKMEMVSVYHLNKGDLLMTHYCMIGNQPRMKLNTRKSTAHELVFDFDGGTNLNPRRDLHMHSIRMILPKPAMKGQQTLTTSCTSWKDGKQNGECSSTLTKRN